MTLAVSNAAAFVANTTNKNTVAQIYASLEKVPASYVAVTLASQRRLSESRRLGSSVLVSYIFTIPSNAVGGQQSVLSTIGSDMTHASSSPEMQAQFGSAVSQATGLNVTVSAMSTPTVVSSTTTTTSGTGKATASGSYVPWPLGVISVLVASKQKQTND